MDSYEKALLEVDTILTRLEKEDVSMDELLEDVKKAQSLIKGCQNKLRNIEVDLQALFNEEK